MKAARGHFVAASLALCLAGVGTVTQGVAVPVAAHLEQRKLETVFEQRLAANLAEQASKAPTAPASASHRLHVAPALTSSGPIARLSVERLGVRETVLAGEATHDQLARGPLLLRHGNAASPVTVLAAHRDTHFLFIRDLRVGDEVSLQLVTGQIDRYRVSRFETVRWDRFAYPLDPQRPLLALTTCYPFGGTEYGGPWRRVAWAERFD